jgi:hypothetical protein
MADYFCISPIVSSLNKVQEVITMRYTQTQQIYMKHAGRSLYTLRKSKAIPVIDRRGL